MEATLNVEKIKVGDIITFGDANDRLPYRVKAEYKHLCLAVRKLDREKDASIMQAEVNNGSYAGLNEAYKYMRMQPVYSIINLLENKRGQHGEKVTFLDLNYSSDCLDLLKQIYRGKISIVKNSITELNIVKIE